MDRMQWTVRFPWLVLGLAFLLLTPSSGGAWERTDLVVANGWGGTVTVASLNGADAIVGWSDAGTIHVRAMEDRVWLGEPAVLGAGWQPKLLIDIDGTYRLFYPSGPSVVTWTGQPGDLAGPVSISAGSQAVEAYSVGMAPDGTLFLAWQQGGQVWWTSDGVPYDGWTAPQPAPMAGLNAIAPRLGDGVWVPRIYYGSLAYRDYQGAGWSPEIVVPLSVAPYEAVQPVLLAGGRHALFYGAWGSCLNYYYLETSTGSFEEQPPLWTFGDGPCGVSDMASMPVDAVVDGSGNLHVFRYEACWEYHDYDIWGCAFQMLWQWQSVPGGSWVYAPHTDFPGSDALALAIDSPRLAPGHAVFAWSDMDQHIHLRFMSPEAGAVPEPSAAGALRAFPNPSGGTVDLMWSGLANGPALLQIYDAGGRLVRSFEVASAGPAGVRWDRLDSEGREAASGMYLARIRSGNQSWSTHLVVLR